jgi:hypothetical protein
MLNRVLRFFLVIFCLYVIISKIYVAMHYRSSDIAVLFTEIIVYCSCISLPLIMFGKIKRIRYTFVFILLLLFGIYIQVITEGINALSQREDIIYPNEYLWIYDIPNIVSVLIMICLLILIVAKSKKHK